MSGLILPCITKGVILVLLVLAAISALSHLIANPWKVEVPVDYGAVERSMERLERTVTKAMEADLAWMREMRDSTAELKDRMEKRGRDVDALAKRVTKS